LNILIVDDSMILRKNLRKVFEVMDYTVVGEAASGYEAVEQFKLLKPDIVTMDITMPAVQGVKNGIDAIVKIREIDNEVKIIVVTSHGEEKLVMEAISKGAKGYILKPINAEKIKEVLNRINH
jgi:two-component system chemotaxis response regulator CheY